MTDEQLRKIRYYLPSPRDPELEEDEYYVEDTAGRIRKVYITDIYPYKEETTYAVREVSTGRRIDSGWGSEYVGFYKYQLYDNKPDCKNREHSIYNGWEELRRLQQREGAGIYDPV